MATNGNKRARGKSTAGPVAPAILMPQAERAELPTVPEVAATPAFSAVPAGDVALGAIAALDLATPAPAPVGSVEEPAAALPEQPSIPALPELSTASDESQSFADTPSADVTATSIDEEEAIMDTMDSATDKTQAMFADANARATGAMEKGAKLFEEWNAFGKGNYEALVESSKIAARGMEVLGQEAAERAKKSFENASQAMRTLATVKSPADFMKIQGDFARTAFDTVVAETSRSTEAMLKLAGDVAQPLSNRFAVAAERMKTVA